MAVVLALVVTAGCSTVGSETPAVEPSSGVAVSTRAAPRPEPPRPRRPPLAGRVVVIDPGHQLGNSAFPVETARPVAAGGFTKPCNTTGTSTDGGYPEATFVWQVSRLVARGLRERGVRVVLTRASNSARAWGPCVDVRGRAGNRLPGGPADAKLSVHADGSYESGAEGFHVIRPPSRAPWTDDISGPSRRFALDVRRGLDRAGFARSTYAGREGIDVRSDLATLNLADVPTVMVELGNMRSVTEARVMARRAGRERYATGLVRGVVRYLRATRR